jgi:hypothetical protein
VDHPATVGGQELMIVRVGNAFIARGRPEPAPLGFVEALLAALGAGSVTRLDAGIEIGSSVGGMAGPYADPVGMLARLDDHWRVRVLLDVMGSKGPVTLKRTALLPA